MKNKVKTALKIGGVSLGIGSIIGIRQYGEIKFERGLEKGRNDGLYDIARQPLEIEKRIKHNFGLVPEYLLADNKNNFEEKWNRLRELSGKIDSLAIRSIKSDIADAISGFDDTDYDRMVEFLGGLKDKKLQNDLANYAIVYAIGRTAIGHVRDKDKAIYIDTAKYIATSVGWSENTGSLYARTVRYYEFERGTSEELFDKELLGRLNLYAAHHTSNSRNKGEYFKKAFNFMKEQVLKEDGFRLDNEDHRILLEENKKLRKEKLGKEIEDIVSEIDKGVSVKIKIYEELGDKEKDIYNKTINYAQIIELSVGSGDVETQKRMTEKMIQTYQNHLKQTEWRLTTEAIKRGHLGGETDIGDGIRYLMSSGDIKLEKIGEHILDKILVYNWQNNPKYQK